jgi:hypothetical protein
LDGVVQPVEALLGLGGAFVQSGQVLEAPLCSRLATVQHALALNSTR